MNLENAFKYLATSSPLVGGQSPPLALMCCIRELICDSRILHSRARVCVWGGGPLVTQHAMRTLHVTWSPVTCLALQHSSTLSN
jgi:hypothetical protein